MPMLNALHQFARVLRHNGFALSQAEIADFVAAAALLGLGDPVLVKDAARATLAKTSAQVPLLDGLFDRYFSGWATGGTGETPGLSADDAAALQAAIAALPAEESGGVNWLMADRDTRNVILSAVAASQDFTQMVSILQIGNQTNNLLGLARAGNMGRLFSLVTGQLAAAGVAEGDLGRIMAWLRARDTAGRAAATDFVRARFEDTNMARPQRSQQGRLENKDFFHLSDREIGELRVMIRRLGDQLKRRSARRGWRRRKGRLDIHRILRANMKTGGCPATLYFRDLPPRRPEVVLLVDVSDSVRTASRLMFSFVHTFQDLFRRVRSFLFVSQVGEATHLFREYDVEEACDRIWKGEIIPVWARTNYGAVFEQFQEQFASALTPKTTFIVLGDGRTNYFPPRAEILHDLRKRCWRILWLNPESVLSWGLGDSAMHEYVDACTSARTVSNFAQLRQFIERLVL